MKYNKKYMFYVARKGIIVKPNTSFTFLFFPLNLRIVINSWTRINLLNFHSFLVLWFPFPSFIFFSIECWLLIHKFTFVNSKSMLHIWPEIRDNRTFRGPKRAGLVIFFFCQVNIISNFLYSFVNCNYMFPCHILLIGS